MKKYCIAFLSIFLLFYIEYTLAANNINFQEAKKQARIIWNAHRITVYCGCKYDKHLIVDHKSCHYTPGDSKRAKRVEWEHIVPVSRFGAQRVCWQKKLCKKKNRKKFKGRNCCELIDKQFREMYTDLHNLVPVIGEVNQARKNYHFDEDYPGIDLDAVNFHGCKIAISDRYFTVVPKDETRGLIARAYLYMADRYSIELSTHEVALFMRWHAIFPPSAWEIEWNNKIHQIQRKNNRFISDYYNAKND